MGDSDSNYIRGSTVDDELAVIIDDDDDVSDSGAGFRPGRRKTVGNSESSSSKIGRAHV